MHGTVGMTVPTLVKPSVTSSKVSSSGDGRYGRGHFAPTVPSLVDGDRNLAWPYLWSSNFLDVLPSSSTRYGRGGTGGGGHAPTVPRRVSARFVLSTCVFFFSSPKFLPTCYTKCIFQQLFTRQLLLATLKTKTKLKFFILTKMG